MSLKPTWALSGFAVLGALACSDGANIQSEVASTCEGLCSKIRECGQAAQGCVEECERTPTLLQADAATHYHACVDRISEQLHTCEDLARSRAADCFSEAVAEPGCADPGWGTLAEDACLAASCEGDQLAECLTTIEDLRTEVPCLSAVALEQAVSCEVTCDASSTSGTVTASHWRVACSFPK